MSMQALCWASCVRHQLDPIELHVLVKFIHKVVLHELELDAAAEQVLLPFISKIHTSMTLILLKKHEKSFPI